MKKTNRLKKVSRKIDRFVQALPDLNHSRFIKLMYTDANGYFLIENDVYVWIPSLMTMLQRIVVAEVGDNPSDVTFHEHTVAVYTDDDECKFKRTTFFKSLSEVLKTLAIKHPSTFGKDKNPFFVLSRLRGTELKKDFYSLGESDWVCDTLYDVFIKELYHYMCLKPYDVEHPLITYEFV